MPLPRPMATLDPDPTPLRSPLRTGAPPTSASAFPSGARTRASPGRAASLEPRGGGLFYWPQTQCADWAPRTNEQLGREA